MAGARSFDARDRPRHHDANDGDSPVTPIFAITPVVLHY
jgi:hypothetical protein